MRLGFLLGEDEDTFCIMCPKTDQMFQTSNRNKNWVQQFQKLEDSATSETRGSDSISVQIAVVGALHLFGPQGVLALLEAEGWTIEKIAVPQPPVEEFLHGR